MRRCIHLFSSAEIPAGCSTYILDTERAIGKGIYFLDISIKSGISFHNFGVRNGSDFQDFHMKYNVGYTF